MRSALYELQMLLVDFDVLQDEKEQIMENLEVALITKKDASGINYCNMFGHKIMQDILNYNPGSYYLRELPFLVGLQPEKTG